jgi:hypothetical protein
MDVLRRAIVSSATLMPLAIVGAAVLQWFPEQRYPQDWRAALLGVPMLYMGFDSERKRDIILGGRLEWRYWTACAGALAAGLFVALLANLASLPRESALAGTAGAVMVGALYGGWRETAVVKWDRILGRTTIATVAGITLIVGVSSWLPDAWRSFWASTIVWVSLLVSAILWGGRADFLRHASVRGTLSFTGTAPLRMRRILNYAVHLGILQRSGGDYLFIHQQLQEHFATRPSAGPARSSN